MKKVAKTVNRVAKKIKFISVQSSAAARATRTSLTAIDRVFARRDFCYNALASQHIRKC